MPYVPIVGADNAGFVTQLLNEPGLKGAAVTNPASIGGAGVTLALQILDGKKPAEHDRPRDPGAVGQRRRRRQGQADRGGRRRRSRRPGRSASRSRTGPRTPSPN